MAGHPRMRTGSKAQALRTAIDMPLRPGLSELIYTSSPLLTPWAPRGRQGLCTLTSVTPEDPTGSTAGLAPREAEMTVQMGPATLQAATQIWCSQREKAFETEAIAVRASECLTWAAGDTKMERTSSGACFPLSPARLWLSEVKGSAWSVPSSPASTRQSCSRLGRGQYLSRGSNLELSLAAES